MELNQSTLGDFVRNAEILFLKGLDSVPMVARQSGIWNVDAIPDHTGDTKEYSEIDLEEYARLKPEGDQAQRARVQQGYSKIGRLRRFSKDIGITVEMKKRNKYTDVISRLTNLGRLPVNKMELDLQHRLTFGTATSYVDMDGESIDTTTGDGKALFATDHLLRASATTFRNRLANNPVFSKGSLEGMEKLIVENSLNQFGEKVMIPYDIIWTTDDPNTINTVREHLRSTASPDSNNSGVVNVNQGKYRHVVLPRVATNNLGSPDQTKAKYWGLASSMHSQLWLGVHEEPFLKAPQGDHVDFATEDSNFGTAAGYFIVSPGARSITISTGDGTA
jgi:hypothetical protein